MAVEREAVSVDFHRQAFGAAVWAATIGGAFRAERDVLALCVAGETDAFGFDCGDGHGR